MSKKEKAQIALYLLAVPFIIYFAMWGRFHIRHFEDWLFSP